MRFTAGGPADTCVLRNAKSPPMCTKLAKSAWKLIALKLTTPAPTFRAACTPSMSSVPRFTALAESELYFTVTESADTVAKSPPAEMVTSARLACSALLPSSLISSARLPLDAVAEKTDPRLRLTVTLSATTSMRLTAGGPALICVLRNAKSPPMCTKLAKSAWKLIALKLTTPAPTFRAACTPSMSSVPRFTALAESELYFTVTESADTVAKSPPAEIVTSARLACSALLPSSLISSARLPLDAVAEKTDPRLRLTVTLSATTSMRFTAGGPALIWVLRNAKSPPMCTKLAKSAWKLIALKLTTPAPTFSAACTPSMSSVPRFTALAESELYFTVTESADTVAKSPPAEIVTSARLACSALLPSSLISSARLPLEAVALKTDPRLRLTVTLSATTSMRFTAGGPALICVLRKAKSPPMCTKLAKSAWKLIALKETTPAPTFSAACTPSMSSVPRLTALAESELYFTVTESADTAAKSPAVIVMSASEASSALVPAWLIRSARLPFEALAVKTEPSVRSTVTFSAVASMFPALVLNPKSPPKVTKPLMSTSRFWMERLWRGLPTVPGPI